MLFFGLTFETSRSESYITNATYCQWIHVSSVCMCVWHNRGAGAWSCE